MLELLVNGSIGFQKGLLPHIETMEVSVHLHFKIQVKWCWSESLLPIAQQGSRQGFPDPFANKMTPLAMAIKYPTKYHVFLASKFLQQKIQLMENTENDTSYGYKRYTTLNSSKLKEGTPARVHMGSTSALADAAMTASAKIMSRDFGPTFQMVKQSWLIPFRPLLEQTEERVLDLSDITMPEELETRSFFLASFSNAFAVFLATSLGQFFVFLLDFVLPNPSRRDGNNTIAPKSRSIITHLKKKYL